MAEQTRSGGGTLFDNLTYDTWMYDADTVDSKIAAAITGGYTVQGTKAVAQLNALAPTVGTASSTLKVGHVYNVSDGGTLTAPATSADATVAAGDNVVWTNVGWDRLTGLVDVSGKQDAITATGILKGTGSGVVAATPGTDYVASLSQATDAVVTVSGSSGALTVDHAKKGPSSTGNTSKGDTSNQTPAFGSGFKVLSATVDKYGHVTALAEHTVTIPSAVAVASGQTGAKNGLMSSADKALLDKIVTALNGSSAVSSGLNILHTGSGNDYLNLYVGDTQVGKVVAGAKISGTTASLVDSCGIVVIPVAASGVKGVVEIAASVGNNSNVVPTAAAVSGAISGAVSGMGAALAEAISGITHPVSGVTVNHVNVVNSGTGIAEIPLAYVQSGTSYAGVVKVATALDDSTSGVVPTAAQVSGALSGAVSGLQSGVGAVSGAVSGEKAKRNAVSTALSTYDSLTQSSSMQTTRNLINALLSALKTFGSDAA